MKKKLAACLLSAAILCSGVTTAWAATPIETGFAGLSVSEHLYDWASGELSNLALNPTGVGFPKLFAEYTNGGDNLRIWRMGSSRASRGRRMTKGRATAGPITTNRGRRL